MINKSLVIASAYSFAPRSGSEAGIGWQTIVTLAKDYRVIVICANHYKYRFNQKDFDYLNSIGVSVIFHNCYRFSRLPFLPFKTLFSRLHYVLWQNSLRSVCLKLFESELPKFLYHATWGNGRVSSGMVGLDVPLIFGPVGGFESPWAATHLNFSYPVRLNEWFRANSIKRAMKSKRLRLMYSKIDLVLAATIETEEATRALGANKIIRLTNAGFDIKSSTENLNRQNIYDGIRPLRILFAGRLLGWKGEELAIAALSKISNLNWEFTILGTGSNTNRCKNLVLQFDLQKKIHFVSTVPQDKVWDYYRNHDLFLFPSLHDSGGIVVLEAMACGMPVICLACGGPREFIDSSCGIVLPLGSSADITSKIAESVARFINDPNLLNDFSVAAVQRANENFSWSARRQKLIEILNYFVKNI